MEVNMKPAEVILSLVVALITTTVFAIVSYFYRLAIIDIPMASTLVDLLEVTTDRVIFMFLGSFVMFLLACKWMGDHYKPTKVIENE
jgi:hypothetical protein